MKRSDPGITAEYERPVKATLHVHLENGDSWPATRADLDKFDLLPGLDAYMRVDDALTKALHDGGVLPADRDITWAQLNSVRYLAELAIRMPELLARPDAEVPRNVADLERALTPVDVSGLPAGPWRITGEAHDRAIVDAYDEPVVMTNLALYPGIVAAVNAAEENAVRAQRTGR